MIEKPVFESGSKMRFQLILNLSNVNFKLGDTNETFKSDEESSNRFRRFCQIILQ